MSDPGLNDRQCTCGTAGAHIDDFVGLAIYDPVLRGMTAVSTGVSADD